MQHNDPEGVLFRKGRRVAARNGHNLTQPESARSRQKLAAKGRL